MRNEEGIAIIRLIFIIVFIAIVITGSVIILKNLWNNNTVIDIKTDLLYIKGKCNNIYNKHVINSEEELLGEEIFNYSDNEEINNIIVAGGTWYLLDQDDLKQIGFEDLKEINSCIVNYETEEIIYINGFEDENGNKYYLSSDIIQDDNSSENTVEENVENSVDNTIENT